MVDVYIVADCRFFNPAAAKDSGCESVDKYNQMIIDNINNTIKNNSVLYFFGDITFGTPEDTAALLKGLKVTNFTLLDRIEQSVITNPDDWYRMGFKHLWSIPGYVRGEVRKKEATIIIQPLKRDMDVQISYKDRFEDREYFIATTTSKCTEEQLNNNIVFDFAMDKWGYYPTRIQDIGRIIDDSFLFEEMEDSIND